MSSRKIRQRHGVASRSYMLAIIGNVIAGLGVVSLFTATLRLTRPGKKQ
jgi:hypothetical protein